jgi:hypothetical protein
MTGRTGKLKPGLPEALGARQTLMWNRSAIQPVIELTRVVRTVGAGRGDSARSMDQGSPLATVMSELAPDPLERCRDLGRVL